jgi:hypothetical protein
MDFDRAIELVVNITTIVCIMWLAKGMVIGAIWLHHSLMQ